ncbi:MAG TPA: hypothetical protein VF193_16330 [Steroidobacter sp.]
MHRAIAAWLTSRPWRAAVAIAFCALVLPSMQQLMPPFVVLVVAIPVLVALRFDTATAVGTAATGAVVAGWVLYSFSSEPVLWALVGLAVLFFSPVALAVLLKQTRSLNLCFQVAVLGAGLMVVIIHAALEDPVAVWTRLLDQLLASMESAGLQFEGERDQLVLAWARSMWGALAALALAIVFGGLLLGRWWATLLEAPGAFGREFQGLKLGLALGVMITALIVTVFVSESALIASLMWVALLALAFQGLAAAHRSKAGGHLNKGWLAAIYVLLIVPLSTSITVFGLAVWGFADNWLRPRASAGT